MLEELEWVVTSQSKRKKSKNEAKEAETVYLTWVSQWIKRAAQVGFHYTVFCSIDWSVWGILSVSWQAALSAERKLTDSWDFWRGSISLLSLPLRRYRGEIEKQERNWVFSAARRAYDFAQLEAAAVY
jgi:hypothetical protein